MKSGIPDETACGPNAQWHLFALAEKLQFSLL